MTTSLPCTWDGNHWQRCQRTNVLWFLVRKLDISVATVLTASSRVKRRKRGSTAVPKTSKKGEERFYIKMRSDYHSV